MFYFIVLYHLLFDFNRVFLFGRWKILFQGLATQFVDNTFWFLQTKRKSMCWSRRHYVHNTYALDFTFAINQWNIISKCEKVRKKGGKEIEIRHPFRCFNAVFFVVRANKVRQIFIEHRITVFFFSQHQISMLKQRWIHTPL